MEPHYIGLPLIELLTQRITEKGGEVLFCEGEDGHYRKADWIPAAYLDQIPAGSEVLTSLPGQPMVIYRKTGRDWFRVA